jgi:hypothetical protein
MDTKFTFDVIGADPMCKSGPVPDVAVSCGLHVHVGTTCEEMAGALFFAGEMNPWLEISYMTQGGEECTMESVMTDPSSCYLTGEFETAATMLSMEDVAGKVFVLHDSNGTPYACATIKPDIGRMPLYAAGFVPYYDYTGSLMVSGMLSPVVTQAVGLTNSDAMLKGMPAQSFTYSLMGADPACADGATEEPNSCGIHIHAGMSCESDGMAHYYSPVAVSDPWVSVTYTAMADGSAAGTIVGVATGYPASELIGHAVVIHDRTGARVACALLAEGMPPMCPEGCTPAAMPGMTMGRRNLLFSTVPTCPAGCEPMMMM